MKYKIGFIQQLSEKNFKLLIPSLKYNKRYKKIFIFYYTKFLKNHREEFKVGDKVIFNTKENKIRFYKFV